MLYPDGKLILFAKAPEAGNVKTRLIPSLGKQGAAELQRRMAHHIIDQVFKAPFAHIELQCYPDSRHPFFVDLLNDYCIELKPQQGSDLGQKMAHAFQQALTHHKYAVIIGTDAPGISNQYLEQAFIKLQSGIDVVLGPAEDGGYVLIGLSRFEADIFNGIEWSTASVLEQTRQRIMQANISCHELATLWDVDVAQDLNRLQSVDSLSYLLSNLEVTHE